MTHSIEPATSGRAKCRGCGRPIAKGVIRLGERLPNPFAEGEMTHWYHLVCAAYKRPEPLLEAIASTTETLEARERLEADARKSLAHRRLPRVAGAQRASTGRARCRSCREKIDKGGWRIAVVYYEEGRFQPSGYIHVRCSRDYFETTDLLDRLQFFSPELSEADLAEIGAELSG